MNVQLSRMVTCMHMSGTKRHKRRERTQNARVRHAQLKSTQKKRTKTKLMTFDTSVSDFFRKIWLEEITWITSHVEE